MLAMATRYFTSNNANGGDDPWPAIVAEAIDWARAEQVAWRDAVILVPFAQHLPLARRAWAASGGWMPRVETTQTLARSLAPGAAARSPALSFDPTADRLRATRLLRAQRWARDWAQRDAQGYAQALDALVAMAQGIWRAAAALHPAARDAWWQAGRQTLALRTTATDPGATERALARVAFEWAQASFEIAAPATDALFGAPASAWVGVVAGGADALVEAVLASAAAACTPCLRIATDPPPGAALFAATLHTPLRVAVCSGFEDEAQRAAAQVLADLAAGARPVALVSLDRLLVRRVRALLERRGVEMLDETGWTLSTTRAAASLVGLLAAVSAQPTCDALLGGLKASAPHWPGLRDGAAALASLEATIRRLGASHADQVDAARLAEPGAALWRAIDAAAARFRDAAALPLSRWLDRLRSLLDRSGLAAVLAADAAGQQVLAALAQSASLAGPADADDTDADADDGDAMTQPQFGAWVEQVLEAASFVPAAPADAAVVITPLARAMLRPFAAIVLPGADEKRLGGAPAGLALLSDAEALALGLPDRAARRNAEALAFAQLLRAAPVTALRRLDDGGEPLAASPLLTRALLARARVGVAVSAAADWRAEQRIAAAPAPRPQPVAPALLPAQLSASACEALRACPYRFFALRMLGLRESPELDDEVEKRDYGEWLHEVLRRFHVERGEPPPPAADEAARLHRLGAEVQQAQAIGDAAFLPFAASFARFVPRYLEWQHARDAAGAQWLDGERAFDAAPPGWGGTRMHGVIDRIDSVTGSDGPLTQLIDYKTGSATALRETLKRPQEDTQLAFYAALLLAQSDAIGEVDAVYLALDDAKGLPELRHPDVASTAQQLVDGIGRDLALLRAGAPLPALGEGRACEFCEARGLCRRDQWAPG